MLRHRLSRYRQLVGELGRRRLPTLGEPLDEEPAARVGERAEDGLYAIAHAAHASSSSAIPHSGAVSRTRTRVPFGSSSSESSTVPVSSKRKHEALSLVGDLDDGVPLLAVVPAKHPYTARRRVELDVVREPLAETLRRRSAPARPRRADRENDLTQTSICNLRVAYSMRQPDGCTILRKEVAVLVPTVLEADGRAERAFDLYSRLLRDRIVFLGRPVDDEIANLIVGQLLFLEADDPAKDIALYVNSPGGEVVRGDGDLRRDAARAARL